jgi:predicted membrane protein
MLQLLSLSRLYDTIDSHTLRTILYLVAVLLAPAAVLWHTSTPHCLSNTPISSYISWSVVLPTENRQTDWPCTSSAISVALTAGDNTSH